MTLHYPLPAESEGEEESMSAVKADTGVFRGNFPLTGKTTALGGSESSDRGVHMAECRRDGVGNEVVVEGEDKIVDNDTPEAGCWVVNEVGDGGGMVANVELGLDCADGAAEGAGDLARRDALKDPYDRRMSKAG